MLFIDSQTYVQTPESIRLSTWLTFWQFRPNPYHHNGWFFEFSCREIDVLGWIFLVTVCFLAKQFPLKLRPALYDEGRGN